MIVRVKRSPHWPSDKGAKTKENPTLSYFGGLQCINPRGLLIHREMTMATGKIPCGIAVPQTSAPAEVRFLREYLMRAETRRPLRPCGQDCSILNFEPVRRFIQAEALGIAPQVGSLSRL